MSRAASRLIAAGLQLAGLLAGPAPGGAQSPAPLEQYRMMEFRPTMENFDKGWKERVLIEFAIVNSTDPGALRAGLKDKDPYVRSVAARALGIRGDRASADALAEAAKSDPEAMVRGRAVESLGLLKMKPETVELATKDASAAVQWVARMAARQMQSDIDLVTPVQKAYAAGIKPEQLGIATVGQAAPDFSATTSDGKPFKLSEVVGKKPIAIYFAAFDG